jgi:hypothetical protein
MNIVLKCPACKGPLSVGEELLGKKVACPSCNAVLLASLQGATLVEGTGADKPEGPTFFQARACFAFKPNRTYRVYVRPDDLVFIRIAGQELMDPAAAAHFGLLGGLLMAAANSRQRKMQERIKQIEGRPLDEVIGDHKHNFRATAEELENVRIEPRSFWNQMGYHGTSQGLLKFRHRQRGKFVLQIPTVDDMRTAVECLPAVLGEAVRIGVRWDSDKQKFVRAD